MTSATPTAGGSVVITVTVIDNKGVAQSGLPAHFQISDQTGGFTLSSPQNTNTNASGQASDTLNVPTPGKAVVDVIIDFQGLQLTCRVVVDPKAPAPVPTTPSGQVGGVLQAPSTGDAGLAGSGSASYAALAVLALFLTTISGSVAFRALKR